LQIFNKTPAVLRRNLIVSGADLNALVGKQFRLQEVEFEGVEQCRPCEWMDLAFGPGAEQWLKGRGGLRARVLSDGLLTTAG
jgi:MOSC domain-containing protein YiiM